MSPSVWDLFAKSSECFDHCTPSESQADTGRGSPACYFVAFDEIQGGHLVTPDYKSGGSRGQFVKVFSLI
jgi:hypothetical protein